MSNIKWAAIQPLTGGACLGAEIAIGHSAEWIMSFKGYADCKLDKDGNVKSASNEYHLLEYLKKHHREVPYYSIDADPFKIDVDCKDPKILLNDNKELPNYDDLDLVIAVPVCSGLSVVTKANEDTKNARNNNMQWITNYTLNVIKPKIYIFENAPTLMGDRGNELRHWFNELAKKLGYSLLYYKTDTCLHNNCQKRPRTFVIFQKHNKDIEIQNPVPFEYQSIMVSIEEFLNRIPKDSTQQISIKTGPYNNYVIDYLNEKYDNDWKSQNITGVLLNHILKNNLMNELIDFIKKSDKYDEEAKAKSLKYIEHIKYKKSLGLNYYGDDVQYVTESMPSIQFRSMPNMLHIKENRIYNIREYLSFMGMPYDFELYGGDSCMAQIGQNVPVGTMQFIVNQAKNIIENWDQPREENSNSVYQNNIKQTIENEES